MTNPGGAVNFFDGTTYIMNGPVVGGVATLTYAGLDVGTHTTRAA